MFRVGRAARRRVDLAAVVAIVAVLLFASSCSSGGSGQSGNQTSSTLPTATIPTQSKDAAAAALVPEKIASKGKLVFGMDASYPPLEFLAPGGTKIIGMDADLGVAIAQVLGLRPVQQNMGFDAIITGMLANRYDIGLSAFTDTVERQQVVDFVNYFNAGQAFYVKSGSPAVFSSTDSLCGYTVAVQAGTVEVDEAEEASTACTEAGKKSVAVRSFPDQNAVSLAVSSGRADVGFADSPVVGYLLTSTNGMFQQSGSVLNSAPYGIAVPKGSSLAFAVQAALKILIANGTYGDIMKKWGTESGAVTEAGVTINGAGR
ncbi:MAG: ABC transporter substrate-binding protein [Acidimicrobiia bacterium]|nr:ABC transporter substrate-binding protein [Acidimicrobiia bacterium]